MERPLKVYALNRAPQLKQLLEGLEEFSMFIFKELLMLHHKKEQDTKHGSDQSSLQNQEVLKESPQFAEEKQD